MKILISLILLAVISSHSTHYNVNRNETCIKPTPAKIYSWHIHLLYWQINENHTKGAFDIRNQFLEDYKAKLGPKCNDLFHQDYLCIFDPDEQPVGPFLTAQWSVFIPADEPLFYEIMTWFLQRRREYDILIHPNSGCELEDHTDWAMWAGKPWEINTDAFGHDQPFPWDSIKKTKNELVKSEESSELVKQFLKEHEN